MLDFFYFESVALRFPSSHEKKLLLVPPRTVSRRGVPSVNVTGTMLPARCRTSLAARALPDLPTLPRSVHILSVLGMSIGAKALPELANPKSQTAAAPGAATISMGRITNCSKFKHVHALYYRAA